jgi:hypothetical protein
MIEELKAAKLIQTTDFWKGFLRDWMNKNMTFCWFKQNNWEVVTDKHHDFSNKIVLNQHKKDGFYPATWETSNNSVGMINQTWM